MCVGAILLLSLTVTGVSGIEVVVVQNHTSGAVGLSPLNLTCDYSATNYRFLQITVQSVSWKKIQNGVETTIFLKQEYNSYGQFLGDWMGRGVTLKPNFGSSTEANIQLPANVLKASDEGLYQCDLQDLNNKHYKADTLVTVYHGPENIIIHDDGTRFKVVEGQNLTLFCEADCNPPCNYTWYFRSEELNSDDGEYYIPASTREDAGNYTCVAGNYLKSSSKEVDVEVFHGAGHHLWFVPPHPAQNVTEHGIFEVTCLANCHPACNLTWYRGNNQFVPSVDGAVKIVNVSRTDSNVYSCNAENSVTKETRNMQLNVQYGPGSSVVVSPASQVIEETKSVTFTCSATCNPNCFFTWVKDGHVPVIGRVLSLGDVKREQAGKYKCRVRNMLGEATGNGNLDVQYQPSISLSTSQGETTIAERGTVKFLCEVDSNPTPRITWTNLYTETIVKQEDTSRDSVYIIKGAKCQDGGQYECKADNGIGYPAAKTIQLDVTCVPRLDKNVIIDKQVLARVGRSVSLSLSVLAFPLPQFIWSRPVGFGIQNITGPRYKEVHNSTTSTLTIANVDISDFGNYTVDVVNSVGIFTLDLRLLRADSPASPKSFYCTNHDETTLELHWLAQQANGAAQSFYIKYATPGGQMVNHTIDFKDQREASSVFTNITDLAPYTLYKFYLTSFNKFGHSGHVITTCRTALKSVGVVSHPLTFLQGIGAGVGICLLLIVFGFVVIYAVRRRYMIYRKYTKTDNKSKRVTNIDKHSTWNNLHGNKDKPIAMQPLMNGSKLSDWDKNLWMSKGTNSRDLD